MDKIIKVKVEEVVVVAPGNVELATPEITTDGTNIIATQNQQGGFVEAGEKTVSIPATELDEDLKPENIAKGVSIFGVEGTKEAEAQIKTQTKSVKITKNGTEEVKADEGYGMETVTIETDVKPTLQEKEITTNGQHVADADYDGLSKVTVNVQPTLQEKTATVNGPIEADNGFDGLSKVVVDVNPTLQSKAVKIENNGTQTITADEDNDGLSEVNIEVEVKPVLQEKTATVNGDIEADEGFDGLSKVNVNVNHPLQKILIGANGTYTPGGGNYGIGEAVVNVQPNLQKKTFSSNGTYTPDNGYDGFSEVLVDVNRSLQNKTITENGTYKADGWYWGLGTVVVDVQPKLQDKTVEITENGTHIITQDDGSDGLGTVEVVVNVESGGEDNTECFLNDTLTYYKNENLTSIKPYAFYNSKSIETLEVPKLTTIEENAFKNSSIQTITLENVNSMKTSVFYGSSLSMDVVMNRIWGLGSGSEFQSSNITSFKSTSCNNFNNNSFYSAKSLSFVDLGQQGKQNVINFNNNIFFGCSALTAVIIRNNAVATLKNINCFVSTPIADGTGYIYVPDELVEEYKSATNWSTYADQILPLSEYVEKQGD